MTNPKIQIDIVGNDQSGRAVGSSEKRIKHLGGEAAKLGDRMHALGRRNGLGSMVRTFGQVEAAASDALGSKSVLGTIGNRIGGFQKLGSTLSNSLGRASGSLGEMGAAGESAAAGLGEAGAAGVTAEGAVVGLGVATASTAAILVSAAAASFKLADGWAKGAASIGRTADIIGVASDKLQAFQGAAERVGVDKATSGAALGGLSQTLNDARYGKNAGATAALAYLGVKMKTAADGTVDVGAMIPEIANAMSRQNSAGRRSLAATLGIPQAALPAFSQGGKQLGNDMADYSRRGAMLTLSDINIGQKIQRRDTTLEQLGGKQINDLQRGNAQLVEGVGDAIGSRVGDLGSASVNLGTAANKLSQAASKLGDGVGIGQAQAEALSGGRAGSGFAEGRNDEAHAAGRYSAAQISRFAKRAMPLISEAQAYGLSKSDAIAIAANVQMESSGQTHSVEKGGGGGRGLLQWTDRARKAKFREIQGVDVEHASREAQWRHIIWETKNSEAPRWRRAHENGADPANVAAGYTRYVVRPEYKARDSAERAAVAEAMVINLEFSGLPSGTSVKATGRTSSGGKPAISHAFKP